MSAIHDMQIERPAALRDQVVGNLRNAIINGQFAPGARLVERQMCDLLGVSRTLVREALRQLEAEGWIRILPNRGPVVISMTPEEVRELYEVRSALEGIAAFRAAERVNRDQLDRLAAAVDAMTKAQSRGDWMRHRQQVQVFYEILREASGNGLLRTQLEAMSARMAWLRGLTLARPERAAVAVKEEARLLAALRARDSKRARELCEAHLRTAGEAVVVALEARAAQELRSRKGSRERRRDRPIGNENTRFIFGCHSRRKAKVAGECKWWRRVVVTQQSGPRQVGRRRRFATGPDPRKR
jgi:DNA-binding GntR family transcriptional regulator